MALCPYSWESLIASSESPNLTSLQNSTDQLLQVRPRQHFGALRKSRSNAKLVYAKRLRLPAWPRATLTFHPSRPVMHFRILFRASENTAWGRRNTTPTNLGTFHEFPLRSQPRLRAAWRCPTTTFHPVAPYSFKPLWCKLDGRGRENQDILNSIRRRNHLPRTVSTESRKCFSGSESSGWLEAADPLTEFRHTMRLIPNVRSDPPSACIPGRSDCSHSAQSRDPGSRR